MAGTHYLAMAVISLGSFVVGILPISFSLRVTRSYPLVLSLLLCLGAGVLLATSLVHMLTEVQVKLGEYSQLYFCCGFLILYGFDEVSHYFSNDKRRDGHVRNQHQSTNYGTLHSNSSEYSPILQQNINNSQVGVSNEVLQHQSSETRNLENGSCSDNVCKNQIPCHVEIGEPCVTNPIAKTGLIVALCIHSILEGISIGVQTDYYQILLILGAVTLHKVVLSFCLGLELHSYGVKNFYVIIAILLFSIGSAFGIFIGMSITMLDNIFNVDAQMQAVAAGTLLYVAAFEVLPRERFRWQHKSTRKAAGILQFTFVIFGFIFITAINFFVVPLHGHGENSTQPNFNSLSTPS